MGCPRTLPGSCRGSKALVFCTPFSFSHYARIGSLHSFLGVRDVEFKAEAEGLAAFWDISHFLGREGTKWSSGSQRREGSGACPLLASMLPGLSNPPAPEMACCTTGVGQGSRLDGEDGPTSSRLGPRLSQREGLFPLSV